MKWSILSYDELNVDLLYEILKRRCEVFVVKQESCYQDMDGKDKYSWHVMAHQDNEIVAYCRVIMGEKVSIGRVLVSEHLRGKGIGHELLRQALSKIKEEGVREVHLSSQTYIVDFYKEHGFEIIGEEYMDVGVPHIDMRKIIVED